MITTRLYLDTRRTNKDGLYPLRLVLTKKGQSAMMSLGINIREDQWSDNAIINHPNKNLNKILSCKKFEIDKAVMELSYSGAFFGKSAKESLELLKEHIDPELAQQRKEANRLKEQRSNSFLIFFSDYYKSKGNEGTKGLYEDTYNKVLSYCSNKGIDIDTLSFADINKSWLESFESYCLETEKLNTASRHLRDIRAVFNAAIDDEKTTNYPFRKFKIKKEESRDKSFTAEELRRLFNHKCYPGGEQESVDMFKLMFCLIGINAVDLANLTEPSRTGRAEYCRAKTHKAYSIKIEPEALEIIRKYAGKEHLVDILERCPNYKTYFNRMGKTLRKVGKERVDGKKSTGKAILPDVCTGSARTSWATIAQSELDIPRDVIAAALGHHTVDVTSTYLRTDWRKKVDEANRKVLDWVFYEKRKSLEK